MAGYSRFHVQPCKILAFSFFLLSFNVSTANLCPRVCNCGQISGSKYVDCHDVNFTTLPNDIPVDAAWLFLSNTKITSFVSNGFSRLSNLSKIELSNNQIENITDGIFNGLPKLETLNILNNGIRRISSKAFAGLTSLKKLALSNNKLTSLPKDLLKDQENLQTLNLDNNLLNTIPSGFLNSLIKLTSLHLNGNNLTQMSREMLQKQTKLMILHLDKNQIESIDDKAFLAAGSTLLMINLDNNRLSSLPRALDGITSNVILQIGLANNLITLIPHEAKPIFERVKTSHGKITLSANPFRCTTSLQWLQTWASQNKHVITDIDQVMCTALDGVISKVLEYNFNKTVSTSAASTRLIRATTPTPVPTTWIQTTDMLSSITHAPALTTYPTTKATASPGNTTAQLFSDSMTSAPKVMSTTDLLKNTTEVFTKMSVTKIQQMPVTGSPSSSNITSNNFTNKTPRTDKADKTVLDRSKHIILATCLSAAFIAIVVFVAMYCFRNKIINRDKGLRSRYDKVRIV